MNAKNKYAIKCITGRNGVMKATLVDPEEAPKGAKLYTAPEAVAVLREAGRQIPFWSADGRSVNQVTEFEYRINRWKKPYIGPKGGTTTKAAPEFL